jgi:hypothetical protein
MIGIGWATLYHSMIEKYNNNNNQQNSNTNNTNNNISNNINTYKKIFINYYNYN